MRHSPLKKTIVCKRNQFKLKKIIEIIKLDIMIEIQILNDYFYFFYLLKEIFMT